MRKIKVLLLAIIATLSFVSCSKEANESSEKEAFFTNLETKDIKGQDFSSKSFGENDLTLVNVWGTFCSPCIAEMPELEELSKEYEGKGVSIKGIVVESTESGMQAGLSSDEEKLALEIMEKTNASYQQLLVSEELLQTNFKRIIQFPTTFFVDKEGNIVGEKVTGANDKESWKKIIEERLEMVK